MAINLILSTDDIGQAFVKSNSNFNEQIVSIEIINGNLKVNKYNGTFYEVPLPIPVEGGQIVSPIGDVQMGTQSGSYNVVTISSLDYIYDGSRYNIATSTIINLSNGDATYDRIDALVLDVTTNTIGKIDGTPSATPVIPTLLVTQILVGAVYVKKGATSLLDYYRLVYTAFISQQKSISINNTVSNVSYLNDLLDVAVSSPVVNEVLTYDGSVWTNSASNDYAVTNGLTSSFSTFKLGGDLSENTTFPMNGYKVTFQGYTQSTSVNGDGNIEASTGFKVINVDQTIGIDSNGLKFIKNVTGSLSLDMGLTAGSTQSYTQSFQRVSGVIALLSDIPAIPDTDPNIPSGEIAYGNTSSTGITSSSAFKVYPTTTSISSGPIAFTGTSTHNVVMGNLLGTFSNSAVSSMFSSDSSVINAGSKASIIGSHNSVMNGSDHSSIFSSCNSLLGTASSSNITGGLNNKIENSIHSNILGGLNNKIDQNSQAFIVNNESSCISLSNNSSILAGCSNTIINSNESNILGGKYNILNNSDGSTVISDTSTIGDAINSSIIGGNNNKVCSGSSTGGILGGNNNSICYGSINSTINGGNNNKITQGSYNNSILNGQTNVICSSTQKSTIIGGECNLMQAGSLRSSILGGYTNNLSSSQHSSIIGGSYNILDASCQSIINGGQSNNINTVSNRSSIIGGRDNIISGSSRSSIIGSCYTSVCSSTGAIINACRSYISSTGNGVVIGGNTSDIEGSTGIILSSQTVLIKDSTGAIIRSVDSSMTQSSNNSVMIGTQNSNMSCSAYSSIIGGINQTMQNSTSSVIIGGNGIGRSMIGRSNLVQVPSLLLTGSMSTNISGTEYYGFTGTQSVGAKVFDIKNGLIISIT